VAALYAQLFVLKLFLDISDKMKIPDETRRWWWLFTQAIPSMLFSSDIFLNLSHKFCNSDKGTLDLKVAISVTRSEMMLRLGVNILTVVLNEAQGPVTVTIRNVHWGQERTLLNAILPFMHSISRKNIISGTGSYRKKPEKCPWSTGGISLMMEIYIY
jgi:hypothetical protein